MVGLPDGEKSLICLTVFNAIHKCDKHQMDRHHTTPHAMLMHASCGKDENPNDTVVRHQTSIFYTFAVVRILQVATNKCCKQSRMN